VLFVTVDGRQPGYSVGMTPEEFAGVFIDLGAKRALNLDGGGSTTMVVDGDVKGRPSDGSERPVSSALLLLPGADPGELHDQPALLPALGAKGLTKRAVWRRIVADPASTGGMAASLVGERRLPGFLAAAARRFARR
jgi:hypothetical protein